jgi:hypothetical protein
MHKYKEDCMHDALTANGFHFIRDAIPDGALVCGVRKRPDFQLLGEYATAVLEVDENQHARNFMRPSSAAPQPGPEAPLPSSTSTTGYSCDCELARMIALHGAFGLPTIFIRFNPDKYVDSEGKTVSASREHVFRCLDYLEHIMERINSAPVADGLYIAYLYYDGMRADHGRSAQVDLCKYDYIANHIEIIDEI